MGKAKEGLVVGEEGQNGDLTDRSRVPREKGEKEERKNQPNAAGDEQQRMNRWGHPLLHHYHHLPQQHHHCQLTSSSKLSRDDDGDFNLYEQVWMPAGHYLPHHSNSGHPFCLDPSLLVQKQNTPNIDVD